MATKQYKVVREASEHDRFFINYSEYAGYRMYLVEAPGSTSYSKNHQYLVTRENFRQGQTLLIDEASEILPVRENSNINLGGNKVLVYRPEHTLSAEFRIVSEVNDAKETESFGSALNIHRNHYRLYNAIREGTNGYNGTLIRIFIDASEAAYGRGMGIPVNETIALPLRRGSEPPHYLHDTTCKNYKDRVWRAIRRAAGAANS